MLSRTFERLIRRKRNNIIFCHFSVQECYTHESLH